jgi:hypothetical protein
MIRTFVQRRLPLIGYLILAVGVLSANLIAYDASKDTDHRQVTEQRAGCERTNDLRRQINVQNKSFLHHNRVTYRLFQNVARTLPVRSETSTEIRSAIREYKIAERAYVPLSYINCDTAYRAVR